MTCCVLYAQMDRYLYNVHSDPLDNEVDTFGDTTNTSSSSFDRGTDYVTTGSVLGELALLSGRPTECVITCETSVQMYKIPYEAIQAAIELFTDNESLEHRLWRVCAIRLATNILRTQPHYVPWTMEKLKLQLEKAILYIKKSELPEGGVAMQYPVFEINAIHMSDIVLAHGFTMDPESGREFFGPCYIPIKIERLVLIVSHVFMLF